MHPVHPQIAIRHARTIQLLAMSFALLALPGCMRSSLIGIEDPHVPLPSLRVAGGLGESKQAPAEPQTGRAVEFSFTKTRGHGEQFQGITEPYIVFNNTTFSGPQQLRSDFDFDYAELSYRWRKFFWESAWGLELAGGVGRTSLGLTLSSPTQSASARFANYGPQGGAAFIWRMRHNTSLHARVSVFISNDSYGISDIERAEIFLAQTLGHNLALRAGYAQWSMYGDAGGGGRAGFHGNFSGPVLDLGWSF